MGCETPTNRKNRKKGDRIERELASMLRDAGLPGARRIPLSGALAYVDPALAGDVRSGILLNNRELTFEAKARKNAWGQMRRWATNADLVYLRSDGEAPLILMQWRMFLEFLKLLPPESRLAQSNDKFSDLKQAAQISPYARSVLARLQNDGEMTDESESEGSKPPF